VAWYEAGALPPLRWSIPGDVRNPLSASPHGRWCNKRSAGPGHRANNWPGRNWQVAPGARVRRALRLCLPWWRLLAARLRQRNTSAPLGDEVRPISRPNSLQLARRSQLGGVIFGRQRAGRMRFVCRYCSDWHKTSCSRSSEYFKSHRCQSAVASRTGVWASGCITQRARTPHTQLPRPASSTSVRSDPTNEQSRTPGCLSLFWNAHTFAEPSPSPGRVGIVYCSQHQPRVLCAVRMQRLSPHDTVPQTLRPNSQLSRVGGRRARNLRFATFRTETR
jgi:hypothetical protein